MTRRNETEGRDISHQTSKPTPEQMDAYQAMFDHFNAALFGGRLPQVVLTLSRTRRKWLGFFAAERWQNHEPDHVAHEIALNPTFLGTMSAEDVASTLVHEMVHLQQQVEGTPSRRGYHNAEWAAMMDAVGLTPSSTGLPGGKRTGQSMTHYVEEGGRFAQAFATLPEAARLPWTCRERPAAEKEKKEKSRNKVAYQCPHCETKLWGKPGIKAACVECETLFVELD